MTRVACLLALAAALAVGSAACRRVALRVDGVPSARGTAARPIPGPVRTARQRLRAYDTAGALSLLRSGEALTEAEAERSWLLAHVWRERTDGVRARAAALAMPRSVFRTALLASLAEDPALGIEATRQALRHVQSPWLHLAAGYLHSFRGDGIAARRHASQALGSKWVFIEVEAHLVLARAAVDGGRLEAAAREAATAARIEPTDIRGWYLAAEASRRGGRFVDAVGFFLETLRRAPTAEGPPRRFAEMLRQQDDDALFGQAAAGLGPTPTTRNSERLALHGLLADHAGRGAEATRLYEDALASGADPIPLERDLRRRLAAGGAYERVVAYLRRSVPNRLQEDPANLLAPAWRELGVAVREAPDARAPEQARVRLARALVALGAVEEGRAVLDGLPGPDARSLARTLSAQIAFTGALGELLEQGYRTEDSGGQPPGLDAALTALGELARRHLPPNQARAFEQPRTGMRSVAFIGSWLDHSTDTTSPVVRHFRQYGTYLVFGQREGKPVEAVLLSLASLTRGQIVETRGHRFHQDVAVGYDRGLRSFETSLGGDLGGACLPDGIWMDADSTRSLEHDLTRGSTRDATRMRMARRGPRLIAADTPEGPFALDDDGGAGLRLALRYIDRRGAEGWGSFDTLRAHEYGHLVEIRRHLPILSGLGASLGLFATSRLSLDVAEQELERRAQLAAVAESSAPDLALAEMLVMLPVVTEEPTPHEGGYLEGLRAIVRHVHARPDLYPEIDRSVRIAPQLDRLSNEQIRGAAEAVLAR